MQEPPPFTPIEKASVKTITVLTVIWAGLMITEMIYILVLPLTLKNFTENVALIGWILAIKPGLSIVIQPLAGIITDKIWSPVGRRALFLIIFSPLLGLCLWFLPDLSAFWQVVVVAALFQLLQDILWGCDHPLLADLIPPNQRTMVMGLMMTSQQIVYFLFLWIGMGIWLGKGSVDLSWLGNLCQSVGLGWLMERHDMSFLYKVSAVMQFIMVSLVAFFLGEKKIEPSPRPKLTIKRYFTDYLSDPILCKFAIQGFVQFFFQNMILGFISLFAVKTLLLSPSEFGDIWKWSAVIAFSAFILGPVIERLPKNLTMGFGYSLSTVACVFGYLATDGTWLLLVAFVFGIGQVIGNLVQKPFFTEYVPRDIIGQISGAYNTCFAVSRTLALGLGGMMIQALGNDYRMIWVIGGIMGVLTVWTSVIIPDRRYEERKRAKALAAG
jgi:MFS family permease